MYLSPFLWIVSREIPHIGLLGSEGPACGFRLLSPPCVRLCLGVLPAAHGSPEFSLSRQEFAHCLWKLGFCTVHIALDSRASVIGFSQSARPVSQRGRQCEQVAAARETSDNGASVYQSACFWHLAGTLLVAKCCSCLAC